MTKSTGGTALYRTYRSRKFDDVVGQDHIVETLKNALANDRLTHAYLFVGPRGVGKTSVARILAHEANGLDYDGQTTHLDVVEIDAASNRGIDEIRDLREKVHLAPASARFKVYIIDEVHMLTAPAFSALLKTLEEPPEHVIFIMATTEGHKLPPTIVSRTQRFSFLPINPQAAEKHLAKIAKQEGLKIEAKALQLVARYGSGSLRDSLGILDQLADLKSITTADVNRLIGLAPEEAVDGLLKAISNSDAAAVSGVMDEIRSQGVSPAMVARQLIDKVRQSSSRPEPFHIKLFADLLEVAPSLEPELKLEAVLLSHCLTGAEPETTRQPVPAPSRPEPQPAETTADPTSSQDPARTKVAEELAEDNWRTILKDVKSRRSSLHAILRQARPLLADDTLLLEFRFEFHRQRVSENPSRHLIEQVASQVVGRSLSLKTALNETLERVVKETAGSQDVSSVISLMGGGDVMEYKDG